MDTAFDHRTLATQCLCLAVRRAARTLSRRYDDALAGLGINNGQFTILAAVSGPEPLSVSALSADLGMDRTTLTAALKPLERDGLIDLCADPLDKRARLTAITAKGRSLLAQAAPRWRKAQAETLKAARLGDGQAIRAALMALV